VAVSGITINTVPAGGSTSVNPVVFTGIVPLGYSNWDGIITSQSSTVNAGSSVATIPPDWAFYYNGPTGQCSANGNTGSANYGLVTYGVQSATTGTWPSSNPYGVQYSIFLEASCGYNNGIVALVKNLNALSIGAQYGASFWYVQLINRAVMPWVGVVFGSATVFSGSPPSTTWTLVTTGTAAATATQMTMAFQGQILSTDTTTIGRGFQWQFDVGIGPFTINGQMAVSLPPAITGLISNEFTSFDDYFKDGPLGGGGAGYVVLATGTASYSIGSWTIATSNSLVKSVHTSGSGGTNGYGMLWFGASTGATSPFGLQVRHRYSVRISFLLH